jgi:hypothetical protein
LPVYGSPCKGNCVVHLLMRCNEQSAFRIYHRYSLSEISTTCQPSQHRIEMVGCGICVSRQHQIGWVSWPVRRAARGFPREPTSTGIGTLVSRPLQHRSSSVMARSSEEVSASLRRTIRRAVCFPPLCNSRRRYHRTRQQGRPYRHHQDSTDPISFSFHTKLSFFTHAINTSAQLRDHQP